MNYKNALITALRALNKNRMRSSLTSIGIIIGVFSVIVMFGLGTSARIAIREKLTFMGTNTIWVVDNLKPITARDIEIIRDMDTIANVTPFFIIGNTVTRYKENFTRAEIYGINREYFDIMHRYAEDGRLFSEKETYQMAKVAVIGKKVAKDIFKGRNPIGEMITSGDMPVRVIGIANEMGKAMTGHDFDNVIFIPSTTVNSRLNANGPIVQIFASAKDENNFDAAHKSIEYFFRKRHGLQPGQENNFWIYTSQEKLKMANDISAAMVVLLAGIASISLFVGGVGIMNIMLVSVTERTREIGIRMAIGARKRDIMIQFLIESTTLSFLGGVIGIVTGLGVYYIITVFAGWPFILSISSIMISSLFSAMVGIFFGYYPSKKAANLKPIEALKYE